MSNIGVYNRFIFNDGAGIGEGEWATCVFENFNSSRKELLPKI